MTGIQCYIDLDWVSSDHIIRVEWVFGIGGKNVQFTYGLGKFTVDWLTLEWPLSVVNPNIVVTPQPDFAYLGWGRPLDIDRASYPIPGQSVSIAGNFTTYLAYWTGLGYSFPKMTTGSVDDSNIYFTLNIDGNHCTATCNGLTLTTQLFPDLADSDSFISWGLAGSGTTPRTPDQGYIHEMQPNMNITSCDLSIFNQAQTITNDGGTPSASYFYGDKYATINSVKWSLYTPTDDSGYLTQINVAPTINNYQDHPQIYKPGYWYTGGAHTADIQEVTADTEGLVTVPKGASWTKQYTFPYIYSGKGFTKFPTGAETIFRSIATSGNTLQAFSRQSQESEWLGKTSFTPSAANYIPKYLQTSNTADQATWDDYQWGKKFTTIYNIDINGQNWVQNSSEQRMLAKGTTVPTTLGYQNRWDTNISNTFASLTYDATYSPNMSENFKALRYWKNESLFSTSYRYQFPFSDIYFDDRLDLGACGVISDPDNGVSSVAKIAFCNLEGTSTIIATLSGDYSEPWIWQHPDGTWVVNWFDSDFYSFKGTDKLGGTFTQYHTQTMDVDIYNIQKLRLANGGEFIVGNKTDVAYPFVTTLVGYYRTGWTEDWQGPYVNEALDNPHTFYITELTTGLVELGYYDYATAAWMQYRTDNLMQDLSLWSLFVP